jgi:hypothetical protein
MKTFLAVPIAIGLLSATPAFGQANPQPPSSPPAAQPPEPPSDIPSAPQVRSQQEEQDAAPEQATAGEDSDPAHGQWVYTQQYGWVWMPYGSQYTYTPTETGASPYEYVYYPSYGWTWLAAPWVFGFGASPFFGALGPRNFVWYNHAFYGGVFRPGFRPIYGNGYRPVFVGHPGYVGPRPGYVGARPGYGVPGGGFGVHGTFQGRPAAPSGGFHGGFGHGGGFGGGHGGGGHR